MVYIILVGANIMENIKVFFEEESIDQKRVHDLLPHWHDGIELIYVDKGSMYCKTNMEVFKLQKGDICFINRNQLHSLSCDGCNSCEHKTFILDLSMFNNNEDILNKYIKPLIEDRNFSHIRFTGSNSYAARIYEDMLEIEKYKEEKPEAYELGIISRTYDIVMNLYSVYINSDIDNSKYDYNLELLKKMIEYIKENYHDEISLNDISDYVGISAATCNRLFKEYANKTPIVFLNNYRLEKAAEKIRNSDDSISNISLDSGFFQQSYFNRVFLKEYGVTPKKYRNLYRDNNIYEIKNTN